MFSTRIRGFLRDESGGYTIWSLIWFSLYVCLGGLAVDITDAYRNETLLQATADASSLAGVMSLPDEDDALVQALAYSTDNMDPDLNGNVLKASEVFIGNWSLVSSTFTDNGTPANAVRVITRRADDNSNPLATTFLRIMTLWGIPFDHFNIGVEAVAIRYVPRCLQTNGILAGNEWSITGNNTFNDICIHGQNAVEDPGQDYGLDIQNNNTIGENVNFSTQNPESVNDRPTVCVKNPGFCEMVNYGDMFAVEADLVSQYIAGYEDGLYTLETMFQTQQDANGNTVLDANGDPMLVAPQIVTINNAETYEGPYEPYHVYSMNCTSEGDLISLSAETPYDKVAVIANCRIQGASGIALSNAVIASTALGNGSDPLNQNSIHFPSNAALGGSGFCTDGSDQVHIYSAASMHISAGPDVIGLRMVAGGNIDFTANANITGISAIAGNDFKSTANGNWTLCGEGGFSGPYAYRYRLVR